jgi:hypothetical protein
MTALGHVGEVPPCQLCRPLWEHVRIFDLSPQKRRVKQSARNKLKFENAARQWRVSDKGRACAYCNSGLRAAPTSSPVEADCCETTKLFLLLAFVVGLCRLFVSRFGFIKCLS